MKYLVILAIVAVLLSSCGGPSEADLQATVQAGVQATAAANAAQATSVAEQVAAAMRATEAAKPTVAPTAPAAPALTVTEYKSLIGKETTSIKNALAGFEALMKRADTADSKWREQIDQQLVAIHTAHQHIEQTAAPEAMRAFHAVLLDGTSGCDAAATEVPKAMDITSSILTQAADRLISCGNTVAAITVGL